MNTSLVSSSSSVFNFGAEHNGIPCVISTRPEDEGTEHQVWFTRQMLAESFSVGRDTITRHFDFLVGRGVLTVAQNCATVQVANLAGAVNNTTLFDLKVFNFLAMRLDTDRAWEVKEKFNDILVEKETKTTLPAVSKEDQIFLNIIHTNSKEQTALALNEYKKFRDEREQEIAFERDEAIRTKAFISSKREATLMGKVGGTTKALNNEREKNTRLLKENVELIKEKEDLKIRLQESNDYKTVRQMTEYLKKYILTNTKSLQRLGKELTKISKQMCIDVRKVDDPLYGKVNTYHIEVWKEIFRRLKTDCYYMLDIR